MSLTIGPAFTIPGYMTKAPPDYDTECEAVVYAADVVVGYPAFWLYYLAGPVGTYPESDAAFEVIAADYDAMRAIFSDPDRWPVVSLRLDGQAWLRIVKRNVEGDAGIDFVEERPGQPTKVFDPYYDTGCSTMTWEELLGKAYLPDERLTWAQRLILMLPLLYPQELPADASEVLDSALAGIGATNRAAVVAALVDSLDWRTR